MQLLKVMEVESRNQLEKAMKWIHISLLFTCYFKIKTANRRNNEMRIYFIAFLLPTQKSVGHPETQLNVDVLFVVLYPNKAGNWFFSD